MLQFLHEQGGIIPLGGDSQDGALSGGQHHESHDALAVHLLLVLLDEDLGLKLVRDADNHGRRARVNPQLVLYNKLFDHGLAWGRIGWIHVFCIKKGP